MKVVENDKKLYLDYLSNSATLFDDVIFREVAEKKDFVEELLQVLLSDKNLRVINHEVQKQFNILDSRSVVLDCFCKLGDGKLVNIEVERNDKRNKCNHFKRVRHYSSVITTKSLKKGMNTDKVPELYMVYLTLKDYIGYGKTVYHIDRVIREINEINDNGLHEIYINAEIDDKTDISEVMKVMSTNDYVNKQFTTISAEKEVKCMPVEVERAYNAIVTAATEEGIEKGIEKGRAEGKEIMLISLFKQNLISLETAINNLNISKEEFLIKVANS